MNEEVEAPNTERHLWQEVARIEDGNKNLREWLKGERRYSEQLRARILEDAALITRLEDEVTRLKALIKDQQ